MDKKRITIHIDQDAHDILAELIGERGQGKYISQLVRENYKRPNLMENIDQRLARIEEAISHKP